MLPAAAAGAEVLLEDAEVLEDEALDDEVLAVEVLAGVELLPEDDELEEELESELLLEPSFLVEL